MMSNDFEEAFSNFLERREFDQASNALFSMVRISFMAGWLAAGGNPPMPQKVFELIRPDLKKDLEGESTIDLTNNHHLP